MSKLDKILVFVVDDDIMYLKSIIIGLSTKYKEQVVFKYFSNSAELFSELESETALPDLILLDYNLEINISGIEVIQKIKSFNSNLDIVMVSSQKNLQTVFSTLKTGARTYIQKSENVLHDVKKIVEEKIALKQAVEDKRKLYKIAVMIGAIVLFLMLFSLFLLVKF